MQYRLFKGKGNIADSGQKARLALKLGIFVIPIQGKRMEFLKDMYRYMMARKKWWLVPILLALVVLGLLLIFAETSVIAPFIYPLF